MISRVADKNYQVIRIGCQSQVEIISLEKNYKIFIRGCENESIRDVLIDFGPVATHGRHKLSKIRRLKAYFSSRF